MRNNVFDYKEEVNSFNDDIKDMNCKFMPKEDDEIGICKKLRNSKSQKYLGDIISESKIKNLFLGSISCLGEKTQDYYYNIIPNISIVRDSTINNGNAYLVGNSHLQQVFLTKRTIHTTDFVAYSHELGHIPSMKKPHPCEFYEYIEAFPILLEYLACKQIDSTNALDLFLKIRLEISRQMAKEYLVCDKQIKNNHSYKDKFFELQKKDAYKYLKSLELVLNLIERFECNHEIAIEEIDKYVTSEKSMKKIAKTLDIETSGCKELMKFV